MPHLLTVSEAADRLRLSASYLDKLRVRGGGPIFVRFGRRVLYSPADLDAWTVAQRARSTSAADMGLGV